ncbi:MAG: hypothetical protein Q9163_000606 [Psora crenata]
MAQPSVAAQQTDNVAHALAGAGGGLLSMTLTYPLITLSTRAQVESRRLSQSPSSSSAKATSTLAAARHIIRREGFSGLYSGLDSALFGISVTNFVYYYWYEWTRSFFERAALRAGRAGGGKRLTTVESMLCGALAGAATVLITNPIWVVNTRMTAMQGTKGRGGDEEEAAVEVGEGEKWVRKKKPSTLATLLALFGEEGPTALFAGVLPAMVLVINPILQYTIFEKLKDVVERRRKATPRDVFLLGALGKLAATSITYPYITLKSRMHVAKGTRDGGDKEGMRTMFKTVIKEEGWAGLYKGIGPKVTQSVITAAFLFAFKDALYAASVKARQRLVVK